MSFAGVLALRELCKPDNGSYGAYLELKYVFNKNLGVVHFREFVCLVSNWVT